MAQARCVGPHARAVLAGWDRGPEPGDADWEWLGVEAAAAALEDTGPDEADVLQHGPGCLPAVAQGRIRARSPRAHPPGLRGMAGVRGDGPLPQVQRRTGRAGRSGSGAQTAPAGLPPPREEPARLAANAARPGRGPRSRPA